MFEYPTQPRSHCKRIDECYKLWNCVLVDWNDLGVMMSKAAGKLTPTLYLMRRNGNSTCDHNTNIVTIPFLISGLFYC